MSELGKKSHIVFVGAGAVGGYVSGHLAHAGYDITVVDPWPENVEAIRKDGLRLTGTTPAETLTGKPRALHLCDVPQLAHEKPFDVAFVCMKSYDTSWAATLIKPYLAENGFIVSLQNGINEERIASVIGWGKTVGCIASSIAVELFAPAQIHRGVPKGGEKHTVFRVGEPHGRLTPRVTALAEMLKLTDSSKTTTNLWGERWSKLVLNSMQNGMSAATGLSGNEMAARQDIRRGVVRIGGEAVNVGMALGYPLEEIFHCAPEHFLGAYKGDGAARDKAEAAIQKQAIGRSDKQRPSMGQDMAKGRRTEIEFLNGLVVARGAELGIDCPVSAAMVRCVQRVERGEVKQGPNAVSEVLNA